MNPLEHLTEISNDFEIQYQRFTDADVVTWCVIIKTQQPNLRGRGDSLEEAIQDLQRQADLRTFEAQLQSAKVGANDVETLKENIKGIL